MFVVMTLVRSPREPVLVYEKACEEGWNVQEHKILMERVIFNLPRTRVVS